MLKFLLDFLGGVFGWLSSVLPDSPFQDMAQHMQGAATGLAWLNWFVPIGDFLLIFGAFLAVLIAWTAIQAVLTGSFKGITSMVGGSK